MLDKSNRIFTKVKASVSSLCNSVDQTYNLTPPNFPHVWVNQLDNPESDGDLENNENAVSPLVEITVYTNSKTKLTDCKKIHSLSDVEMRLMGFERTFGPQQVTNTNDTNVCRMIARYTRLIGNNDVI